MSSTARWGAYTHMADYWVTEAMKSAELDALRCGTIAHTRTTSNIHLTRPHTHTYTSLTPGISDLTIVVQGEPVRVHKALVWARSKWLRTLLAERWAAGKPVEITTLSAPVFRCVVEYLYTGYAITSSVC